MIFVFIKKKFANIYVCEKYYIMYIVKKEKYRHYKDLQLKCITNNNNIFIKSLPLLIYLFPLLYQLIYLFLLLYQIFFFSLV